MCLAALGPQFPEGPEAILGCLGCLGFASDLETQGRAVPIGKDGMVELVARGHSLVLVELYPAFL